MKTLKLVFHESKLIKRKEDETETLTFKGYWDNDSAYPAVTLSISGCKDGKALEIRQDLDILAQGEYLYIDQGENPQKRLDHWLTTAVRRKEPKVADFEAEIEGFDTDMSVERYNALYDMLKVLIDEDKTETKKFAFLLECLNAVRAKIYPAEDVIPAQELIANVRGIGTAHADVDIDDDWDDSDEEE